MPNITPPQGITDFDGELKPVPEDFAPEAPSPKDHEAILKNLFTRTVVDPVSEQEFEAHEIRDIFRFGWFRTNLGISIGKCKKVGIYDFDAGLLPPVIAPKSFFAPADYKELHHCLRFYIKTKSARPDDVKLPGYLKEWHKEDIPILRGKFNDAKAYLQSRAPANIGNDWNLFKHNRHPRDVQRAHHVAALSWQLMQGFERSQGFKAFEIDAWSYVVYIEIAYSSDAASVDRSLIKFVADRIKDSMNLEDFNPQGYQNHMLRYVFLAYYLGEAEAGWDAACGISKLRGTEFTKSPLYDYVIEMRDEPTKFSDMFNESPKELLTYFRM